MNHSETHSSCNTHLEAEGGQARCCYCEPHDGCKMSDPDQSVRGQLDVQEWLEARCKGTVGKDGLTVFDLADLRDDIATLLDQISAERERAARIDELDRKITMHVALLSSKDYKAGFSAALDQIDAGNELRKATLRQPTGEDGTGRMTTQEELAAASKSLGKAIDKNIDVFKRLADK